MTPCCRTSRAASCLLISACFLAFGQQPRQSILNPVVPDSVLYQAFFTSIRVLDNQAARIVAAGKDPRQVVNMLQIRAQLTDGEAATVKTIARKCNADLAAFDAKVQPLVKKGIAEAAANPAAETSVTPQLREFDRLRPLLAKGCIEQLKTALGPTRFTVLDGWVRSQYFSRVTTGDLPARPSKE